MDDSTPLWPAWKFGLKHEDLFTTLHEQYNTFPSAIQDREAFHHDVVEISTKAQDLNQFKDMLSQRRKLRLCELNEALDSTAQQVIGDPSLLADETDRWTYALRIFRWQSLDALVQYFASYLPPEQRNRQLQQRAGTFPNAHQATQPRTPSRSPLPLVAPYRASSVSSLLNRQPQQQQSPPKESATSSFQAIPKPHAHRMTEVSGLQQSGPPQLRLRTSTLHKLSEQQDHSLRRSSRIADRVSTGRVQRQATRKKKLQRKVGGPKSRATKK